ncbi:MAG: endonuclease/exonuclease/phosphatase family protein, partial [Planctomycetaceae bacterium]|nr:endonuclease/exonuclease/phosphatase family protein [Planctomycetaceae bacterium]
MKKSKISSLSAICVIALLSFTSAFSQEKAGGVKELKVLSFNIWGGGGKSAEETANVIKQTGADIVGIQEPSKNGVNTAEKIAADRKWYSHGGHIISRYPIVKAASNGRGCKIQIGDNRFVWMFNVHLMYCPYEPYQLNGIEYCGAPLLNTAEEAVASAWKTRGKVVEETISDIKDAQKEGYPIFLTGDFNEPSCLDWTEKAVKAGICKIPVVWPSTKAFMEKAEMKDSYRIKYPDETAHKGHTWTTLPAKREVLDRIDFVFFHGNGVKPADVQIVGENSDLSDIKFEKYPSDHRAV